MSRSLVDAGTWELTAQLIPLKLQFLQCCEVSQLLWNGTCADKHFVF